MSFNYDNIKKDEHANWWTSYADLFMMLSIVFLLMYVAASLRSGAAGHQKKMEYDRVSKENSDLKEQIKVYNTLKDQQVQQSNDDEQATYRNLMDKLNLLQDEAKSEKSDLERQAKENGQKAQALNQYQQVIRNIINANILAKTQIQHREKIIVTRDETIEAQDQTIETQNQTIQDKEQVISRNQKQIFAINDQLAVRVKQLKKEQKNAQITRKQAEYRIAKLREETEQKVSAIEEQTAAVQNQLQKAKQVLSQKESELAQTESKLGSAKQMIDNQQKEQGRMISAVEGLKKQNSAMQGDLERARELANARKNLAKHVEGAFRAAGIKAEVNPQTGVATLDFGEEYFDTGSSKLKPGMQAKLDQFFPTYTQSLLSDKKISENLASLEIIGFASSTFRGKYVNPTSLRPEDRDAINYNMNLSSSRAQEIFKHVLGSDVLSADQKKKILPLLKVVGRGYLPDGKSPSEIPNGMKEEDFCKQFNCKKAQRVIVKFNLKD